MCQQSEEQTSPLFSNHQMLLLTQFKVSFLEKRHRLGKDSASYLGIKISTGAYWDTKQLLPSLFTISDFEKNLKSLNTRISRTVSQEALVEISPQISKLYSLMYRYKKVSFCHFILISGTHCSPFCYALDWDPWNSKWYSLAEIRNAVHDSSIILSQNIN